MANMQDYKNTGRRFIDKYPVIANILIILIVAFLGILIAYLSLAVFTKHGRVTTVPSVENQNYSAAIEILHDAGFKTEIRDSVFRDDVRPGVVVEQFPRANSQVKPGRKIFLYINAVHPKEVVIDEDPMPTDDALRSYSLRQGMARLEELGFKNIRIVKVLGDNDCIVKITANGQTVKKTQKVPVNAQIVVQVYDGRLSELRDSLQNSEYASFARENQYNTEEPDSYNSSSEYYQEESEPDYIGD